MTDAIKNDSTSPIIIVVDDDEDTRLNLRDILELDGYRVELAGSARDLFARGAWDDVALVLLDRKLPDGTPQDVLPRIRQEARDVAVIIVTGYGDIEGAIAALRSGAADYILKPVSADALRASIRRVLERQQAEREIARLNSDLARSEARDRSLFENTLDGLLIIDDESRIVAANPAAGILVGFAVGALEGKRIDSLTLATSEGAHPATAVDFLRPGMNAGQCTLLRDDATEVDVEYRAAPSFTPGLHLLSFRDITARKQAEERAQQTGRLAAIGETMAGLVHESRNALQRSKMLSLEVEDRPEALKLVARAQKAQEELHRLYEEVRQWAAPLNLRREQCSQREIWREVWCLVNQAHPRRAMRLEEEIACSASCNVDRFAMSQVFRNIFENAPEASPTGAPVTVPKTKGTGLGMAIVQRLVQSHGGTVSAVSPGGAQITITLPLAAQDSLPLATQELQPRGGP